MIINSNTLTFIDTTDTKKIDIHISSNHPTVQIYNGKTYTPNWGSPGKALILTATVHADSTPVTNFATYKWVKIIGSEITEHSLLSAGNTLTISENIPSDVSMIRYKCYVTYNKKTYTNEITFTRINDGAVAPTVQAHYSVDGNKANMEATLDPAIHKYIHFSYDGGKNWTEGIKIVGEQGEAGQSISLKGTAYTDDELIVGGIVTLYSDETQQNLISGGDSGDSYLVGGYLCVYNGDKFICTGQIQGPKGNDGTSYYLYIRYADDTSGSNFSDVPGGRKYIGFYRSAAASLPTDIDKGSATWNWAKFVGEDVKSVVLTGNAQVFKVDKNNVMSPTTIKVTAQTQNTSVTSWSYNTDGSTIFTNTPPAGVSLLGDVVTITGTAMTSNLITIKASDGVHSDIFTVYKVSDGSDGDVGPDGKPAPIVFLTNENITFSADENGQVPETTVYCNVVAYSGTTQVTPTIGVISSARLPSGMSINPDDIVTVADQIQIPIAIEDGATLGSTQNTNGEIHIPIISPVETTLQLNWSKINSGKKGDKGDNGVGIKSTTVTYGVSDSASVQPLDDAWQSSIPIVADGKYLWTRTIIDYTDDTLPDTVTYTYAKQGVKGDTGSNGSSVTVSSIQYKEGTSATIAPTGTWSNSVVDVAEGKYLWTKTVFSDGKIAYGIAKQGVSGKNGADAYTVMLTNESHIFAGDATKAIADSVTTQVLAYKGTSSQIVTIIAVNNQAASTSDTNTGIPGLKFKCSTLSGPSPIITFTCTTDFVSESGSIPITLSVDGVQFIKTFAYSISFKGADGKGISSIVEEYYQSTSSTAQSGGSWSVTPPTWANGKYIWTRSIITYTDNTTSTTSPICITGQKGGTGATGIGVSSVDVWYYQSTSATSLSGGSWSTTTPTWVDGKYIWTKTITTYTNSTTDETAAVCITGQKGATGVGIKSVTEYYLATSSASGVTSTTSGWTTSVQTTTSTKKYLWNYEVITYTDNSTNTVAPVIIGVYGDTGATGKGVSGVTEYYLATDLSSGVTLSTSGWTTTMQVVTSAKKYLWNYEVITYTDGSTSTINPILIGVYGDKGDAGTSASLVRITPSAYYFKSTTGKDGTFEPDYIYLYPRFQTVTYSVWQYSIDGGKTWVSASGANGLAVSTYNSIPYTLRVARSSALYTDTVTSISFRCVSSNASVYDTVSIAKIYDVVDLQIGGTNLIKNGDFSHDFSYYWNNVGTTYTIETDATYGTYLSFSSDVAGNLNNRIHTQTDHNFSHESNATYTVSFYAKSPSSGAILQTNVSGGNLPFDHILTTNWKRYTATYTTNTSGSLTMWSPKPNEIIHVTKIKLEKGNKATDWSPAPEDFNNITFQIYAPNGYLLTNELQSLTLQTFAYEGSIEITSGATFQWSQLIDNTWTAISGATGTTLTVTKSDVLRAKSYRCVMTYKSKEYTSTITVQDKTDAYNSIMCLSSNAKGNECYWVLYTLVYSDTGEVDPLLGPISINAPTSPVNGDYWYAVDATNTTVQLKKYNGTSWVNSTDKQSLTYLWNIVNDGSSKTPIGGNSKVQVISCHDFTATATVLCDVSNEIDGVITQSSLSITDASDPIVSVTAPTSTVDGQIWIKPNANGAYNMFVWSQSNQNWIPSDVDTKNKVYTTKPSSYNKGDIWITESDTIHSKYKEGTLLQASKDNTTYSESDWSATLKYDKDISQMQETLYNLSQYVTITSLGLKISAVSNSGELSPFTSLFTSTELAFYQDSEKLLTLANNQLIAPRIVVEKDLEVQGTISLGGLQLAKETNGSFSFTVTI